MIEAKKIADELVELYHRLLAQPLLPKGESWADEWTDWELNVTWYPDKNGVYVLWPMKPTESYKTPPIYIGEGLLGTRIWESFNNRPDWYSAQMIVDDLISGNTREHKFWRKALERFSILALTPRDNVDQHFSAILTLIGQIAYRALCTFLSDS